MPNLQNFHEVPEEAMRDYLRSLVMSGINLHYQGVRMIPDVVSVAVGYLYFVAQACKAREIEYREVPHHINFILEECRLDIYKCTAIAGNNRPHYSINSVIYDEHQYIQNWVPINYRPQDYFLDIESIRPSGKPITTNNKLPKRNFSQFWDRDDKRPKPKD